MSRTFHNLSAGSTTILPNGKVIRFGGKVEQVEGGSRVGHGTHTTSDPTEIEWLEGLCKMPSPQVWEEKDEASVAVPIAVAAGHVADAQKAAEEVAASAIRSTDPKVIAAADNLSKPATAAAAK